MTILDAQGQPIRAIERSDEHAEALTEAMGVLRENYWRLELELEQAGWQRENRETTEQPSRQALRTAQRLARLSWLKNPWIRRAVDLQASYTMSQGVSFKAMDPEIGEVLKAFLEDPQNVEELTGHQTRVQKDRELALDGNLYIVFFVNVSTGAVKLSTIPPDQVERIVCDPDNAKSPRYYERRWMAEIFDEETGKTSTESRRAYYPAVGYQPKDRRESLGEVPVRWESPVLHVKVGGFADWLFGFPEVEVARPYAASYKDYLTDWATIAKSLARFAWRYAGSQSAAETSAVKAKLNSTTGQGGRQAETNPPPVAGSVAVLPAGRTLDPVPTKGATISAEDGRQLRVAAIAATGFADHFFGDTAQGTLATAKSLDRPTELRIRDRQELWSTVYQRAIGFALLWAVKAASGPLRKKGKIADRDGIGPDPERVEWSKGVDPTVQIDWPKIVEQDLGDYVKAVMLAAPKLPAELVSMLLMIALEVEGIDQWLEQLRKELAQQPKPPAPASDDDQEEEEEDDEDLAEDEEEVAEERFVEAVRGLRESLDVMLARNGSAAAVA